MQQNIKSKLLCYKHISIREKLKVAYLFNKKYVGTNSQLMRDVDTIRCYILMCIHTSVQLGSYCTRYNIYAAPSSRSKISHTTRCLHLCTSTYTYLASALANKVLCQNYFMAYASHDISFGLHNQANRLSCYWAYNTTYL